MNSKRITRLLKIVQILQSGAGFNIQGLANACEVSRRTMFRDIEALKHAGYPISYDPDYDRYTISNGYFLHPINFTPDEAISLMSLAVALGRDDRIPFFDQARSAAHKLEQSLSVTLRNRLKETVRAIRIDAEPSGCHPGIATTFKRLLDARTCRNEIQIEYHAEGYEIPIQLQLKTYWLSFSNGSWFAIGKTSGDGRTHRLELKRIVFIRELDSQYVVPTEFKTERFGTSDWDDFPAAHPCYDVLISFDADVAGEVAANHWHHSQIVEPVSDGSIFFRVQISRLDRIASWILGFGKSAQVIGPSQLRELMVAHGAAIVSRNETQRRLLKSRSQANRHPPIHATSCDVVDGSGTAAPITLVGTVP